MRFDVRLRLLFISILTLLPFICPSIPCFLVVLGTEVALLYVMRISVNGLFYRLRKLFLLFLGLAILQSVFVGDGQPLFTIFNIPVLSLVGIHHSMLFFLRMLCIFLAGCMLLGCHTQEITQGLHQIGLPYDLCLLAMIGLKFVPILQEKFTDTLLAMELRGISVQEQPLRVRFRLLSNLFLPTVISAFFTAKQVATSLQVRGFRAQSKRTQYRKLVFATRDWVGLVCAIGYVSVFCAGRLWLL